LGLRGLGRGRIDLLVLVEALLALALADARRDPLARHLGERDRQRE